MWDPYQYSRFSGERSRPFYDLFNRLGDEAAGEIVDLGCGAGDLTRLFAKRWRNARVLGVDSSSEMLSVAHSYAIPDRLEFQQGDISSWNSDRTIDLLFSNAALQWLPDHEALIPRLAGMVAPGGRIAVQMPDNFTAPSHQVVARVRASQRWSGRFGQPAPRPWPVKPVEWYASTLMELGFAVDAWATEYLHILQGERAVLEWIKGTALRPSLQVLSDPEEQKAFLDEVAEGLEEAYPRGPFGTFFPFRRVFFVGRRG